MIIELSDQNDSDMFDEEWARSRVAEGGSGWQARQRKSGSEPAAGYYCVIIIGVIRMWGRAPAAPTAALL